MGRNLWQTISNEVRGGPMALFLWLMGVAALFVGASLSWEDWVSSYAGLQSLEAAFGLNTVSEAWIMVVMAVTPWVGQIVFMGLYTLDTDRKWALGAAIIWFLLDYLTDVQYRSNGVFVTLETGRFNLSASVGVSAAITFLYFTVGAEMFVTAGVALVTTLFQGAVVALAEMIASTREAFGVARGRLRAATRNSNTSSRGSGGGNHQSRRPSPPPDEIEEGMAALFGDLDRPMGRSARQQQGLER